MRMVELEESLRRSMTKSGRLELKGKPREKAKKCVGGGNEGRGREGIVRDRGKRKSLYTDRRRRQELIEMGGRGEE